MKRLALAAALALAGCGKSADPQAAPPPPPSQTDSTPAVQSGSKSEPTREAVAQAMFDAAAKAATLDAFHAVAVRDPLGSVGRRAIEKCAELEKSGRAQEHSHFEALDQEIQPLVKSGNLEAAIAKLTSFAATATDVQKRLAQRRIAEVENEARRRYVDAVRAARSAPPEEAGKLLKAAAEKSTAEIREACERDLSLLARAKEAEEARRVAAREAEANKLLGDRATGWLKRIRERAFAEVLKDISAAIADPKLESCKERLTADHAAVTGAASFWEAVQKSLKARLNQEVTLRTTDNKLIRGVLRRVQDASVKIESLEIPLASFHADQLVLLGISRDGLAEDSGDSFSSAAMWFFLEGRQEPSRLYLATAIELESDVTLRETAWRRGFFRSALGR